MKAIGIVLVALAVVLEALVITGISETRSMMANGGDVITMASDGIKIGGQTFAKGTYVMTTAGLVRLPWHWLLKYAYAAVPSPLVIAALGIYLARRRGTARPPRGAADA